MEQLLMYHRMDAFVEHPVPEGFFVRKFRPDEERAWVEINQCGIFGPVVGKRSSRPLASTASRCSIREFEAAAPRLRRGGFGA